MKKKILCIFIIILTILAGCAKEEKSNIEVSDDEVGIETMEGMNYLVAGNDYGFYFDVYSILEVIVFCCGLVALKRNTIKETAYMILSAVVIAVILNLLVPFHFS